jgi:hypothetical protein
MQTRNARLREPLPVKLDTADDYNRLAVFRLDAEIMKLKAEREGLRLMLGEGEYEKGKAATA